jgi:hypothetical protein
MASPTEAEIKTQVQAVIRIWEQFRKFVATHTAAGSTTDVGANYLAMEDTLFQSLESNYVPDIVNGIRGFRGTLNSAIQQAASATTPLWIEYAKQISTGAPETDIQSALTRIYDHYAANSKRVTSRQFTFGSVTAGGSNAGTGTINRLTKDERNFDIENTTADIKTLNCISDASSGADQHEEVFEILGAAPEPDLLKITGSGKRGTVRALSARDSLLSNSSFSSRTGTDVAPTAITDWTVTTDIANFQLDATNYYRGFPGDSTPRAVLFETNDKLTQAFTVRNIQLNPNTPIYAQLAYNRQVFAGDGTLTFTVGNVSANVVLAAQTGWNILRIAIGQNNWHRQIDKQNPVVSIELSGNTTGDVLVDDVIVAPYTPFDGLWYAAVGGATPFLRNDTFSFTDTEVGAILQHWLWRSYGRYLPHSTGGSVTFSEPSN